MSNCDMLTVMFCIFVGLLQLAPSDKVEFYKDKLEEAETQITSMGKDLAEYHVSKKLTLERNMLTSSLIREKKQCGEASIAESGAELSGNVTDDAFSHKRSYDKKIQVQKKLVFSYARQPSQYFPSFPETHVKMKHKRN